MPRVREIESDGGDPVLREIFAKEREAFGLLFNTTKVLAHCPPILHAAKNLSAAIERSGLLDPQDDELFSRVRQRFSEEETVELAAAVALENFRSKLNVALGVESQGFCVLPSAPRPG